MKIRLSEEKEWGLITDLVREHLSKTKAHGTVGERFLYELENLHDYKGMFMIVAERDGDIVGVTNGVIDGDIAVSYHTIAFAPMNGYGSALFRAKLEHSLMLSDQVIAKPESIGGLRLCMKYGFQEYEGENRLYWGGPQCHLTRLTYVDKLAEQDLSLLLKPEPGGILARLE